MLKPGLPCYSFTLLREKWHGGGEGAAASGDIYSLKSWAIADLKALTRTRTPNPNPNPNPNPGP